MTKFRFRKERSRAALAAMCGLLATLVCPGGRVEGQAEHAERAEQAARAGHTPTSSAASSPRKAPRYGRMPMRFEANAGQVDGHVRFVARAGATALFLTDAGATLRLRAPRRGGHGGREARDGERGTRDGERGTGNGERGGGELGTGEGELVDTVLRMKVAGGRDVSPRAEQKLATISNYFIGNEPAKWHTDVPNFGRVVYPGVLEGVDLVYHGEEGQLEYDFVVAPGADSGAIALEVSGAKELSLTAGGDLAIRTEHGVLVQPKPRVYQRDAAGSERDLVAGYRLVGERAIGFEVAAYDKTRELVIDPVLEYSTYVGGSGQDEGNGIAVDAAGAAYVTGTVRSVDFPTQIPVQASNAGGTPFPYDAFVLKLSPAGNALEYATYLGGSGEDLSAAIAVDAMGSAYLTGQTTSLNFPTQRHFQSMYGGVQDGFVSKLSPRGNALEYSTYLGGAGIDAGSGIAVDGAGSAYVTGTASARFPTQGAFQASVGGGTDAFLTKLSPAGDTLEYSTFLGGSGNDDAKALAVDGAGSAYVTGQTSSPNFPLQNPLQAARGGTASDAFVSKLSPDGTSLVYSTLLGGTGADTGRALAVDLRGSAYVVGYTIATDFPTVNPLQAALRGGGDGFVTKLSPLGDALDYSTYLGGASASDDISGVAVDTSGHAYVTGSTSSVDLPVRNAIQGTAGGNGDAFVTKLSAAGDGLDYSTYLGGAESQSGRAIAVDVAGSAYVTGTTRGNLPVVNPFQAANAGVGDVFVSKLTTAPLALTPPATTVAPGDTVTFVATAGSGAGYVYSLQANASGGTIDPVTGVYTAGPTDGVTDVVLVTDSQGATATADVAVTRAMADAGADASDASADANVVDAAIPDAAVADASADAAKPDAGPVADAGPSVAVDSGALADASAADAAPPVGASVGGGGCSCHTSGGPSPSGAAGLALFAAVTLAVRRRRG